MPKTKQNPINNTKLEEPEQETKPELPDDPIQLPPPEVKPDIEINVLELYRSKDKRLLKNLQRSAEQMTTPAFNDYVAGLDADFISKALLKPIPRQIETRHIVTAILGVLTLVLGLLLTISLSFAAPFLLLSYFFIAGLAMVNHSKSKENSIIALSAQKLTPEKFKGLIEKAELNALLKHITKDSQSIMTTILEQQPSENIVMLIQKILLTRKQPSFLKFDQKYVIKILEAKDSWAQQPGSLTKFLKIQPHYLGFSIAVALMSIYLPGDAPKIDTEVKAWLLSYCKTISAAERGRLFLEILSTLKPNHATEKLNRYLEKLEILFSLSRTTGKPVWSFDRHELESTFDKICEKQSLVCGSLFLQKLIKVSGTKAIYELNPSSIAGIMLLPFWSAQPDALMKLIKLLNPNTYATIAANCRALQIHHASAAPSPELNQWLSTILKEDENNLRAVEQADVHLVGQDLHSEPKQDGNVEEQNIKRAIDCFKQKRALAKIIRPAIFNQYLSQLENPNDRSEDIRIPLNQTRGYKYVHLENKIVKYVKKRRIKPPHIYIKKNSHTYISPNLRTPLFGTHHIELPLVGYVSDRNLCKVKAYLTKDKGTVNHQWVGDYFSVLGYWFEIRSYNARNFNEFEYKLKLQGEDNTNELLVKNNKEGMVAVIVGRETPQNKLLAIQYKKEAEARLNKNMLPILFYNSALGTLKPYRINQQEMDLAAENAAEMAVKRVINFLSSIRNWKLNTKDRYFFSPIPKEVGRILNAFKVAEHITQKDFSGTWQNMIEKIQSELNPGTPLVISEETQRIYNQALKMLDLKWTVIDEQTHNTKQNFATVKDTVVHSFG